MLKKPSEDVVAFINTAKGVVEATNCEKLYLWHMYSQQADDAGMGMKNRHILKDWKQRLSGYGACVGETDGHQTWISLLIDNVGEFPILFWHATSSFVDYSLIEKWMFEYVPAYKEHRSDATNFFNVFPQ